MLHSTLLNYIIFFKDIPELIWVVDIPDSQLTFWHREVETTDVESELHVAVQRQMFTSAALTQDWHRTDAAPTPTLTPAGRLSGDLSTECWPSGSSHYRLHSQMNLIFFVIYCLDMQNKFPNRAVWTTSSVENYPVFYFNSVGCLNELCFIGEVMWVLHSVSLDNCF